MNVLVVTHYYPPHLGGIENVAHAEATRLASEGHRVTVLTSSPGGAAGTAWDAGAEVRRVAAWNGIEDRTGVPFPVFSPMLLPALWQRVRRSDVVHIHDSLYVSSWIAALFALLLRRPVVLTQHVGLIDHPSAAVRAVQRLVYATAGGLVLRSARQVLVLNGRVAAFVQERGVTADRIMVLPNGVDTALFRPPLPGEQELDRESLGLPAESLIALFVGRFVPKKGFGLLLAAAADLPDKHLVVLAGGTGPAGPLPGNCVVTGPLPPTRLARLYRAADAFVLPSEGEGFPLTAQEAMASGLPVVLGDDPGYGVYGLDRDLIRFVGRDREQVGEAIRELLDDAALRERMGAYSCQVAVSSFGWQAHLERLEGVYSSVIAGRQS